MQNRTSLHPLLAERIAERDRDALLAALAARHVPAGAVNDLPAVFSHPAAQTLVVRDGEGALAGVRHVAFRFDGESPAALSPPPHYAAHTRAILTERLGYSADEIERLSRAGTVTGTR